MTAVWNVVLNTIFITSFVAMTMLLLEYFNVFSRGVLMRMVVGTRWRGYVLGALFGALPGCLGAYAMVSLFAHKRVTPGALVATMIATSGDEAFVMLGLFPVTAVMLFLGLGILGFAVGWLTDHVVLKNRVSAVVLDCDFEIHPDQENIRPRLSDLRRNWTPMPWLRIGLVISLTAVILLMTSIKLHWVHVEGIGHEHACAATHASADELITHEHADDMFSLHPHVHGVEGATYWILMVLLLLGLFILVTVPGHFLEAHLFAHVLRKHVPHVFFWSLGALVAMEILNHTLPLQHLVSENLWIVFVLAILLGIIPESGPHLIFVFLYAQGALPLSVLIASCIVQDGHGTLPLLAHSRRDFVVVKLINVAVGLLVGGTLLAAGL